MPPKQAVEQSVSKVTSWYTLIFGYISFSLLGILSHWPALHGGFIWDDDAHITRSTLQSLHGLFQIWTQPGTTQQYYPLLHSLFWFEHILWGDTALFYHLANILLHALAALLLVITLRKLSIPGAWLTGILFIIHPIFVESIAWISEEKNTVSAIFYFSAAYTYIKYSESKINKYYALATGLFVLALLTKSVTATLPAVLILLTWWKTGKITWKENIKPLTPWFIVGILSGLFTAWVEVNLVGAHGSEYLLTFPEKFLLSTRILCFYLGKIVLPLNLSFIYEHWRISLFDSGAYYYVIITAFLLVACIGLYALESKIKSVKNRTPIAALLYFSFTLFPVLGFFNIYPFRYAYVADHFQYLASLGLITPLCSLLWIEIKSPSLSRRSAAICSTAIIITVLGYLTYKQSSNYSDAKTLYTSTLRTNPTCWMAHNNLGTILLNENKLDEAAFHYQEALRLDPSLVGPHANLGTIYSKNRTTYNQAVEHFELALKQDPSSATIHNTYGSFLLLIPSEKENAYNHITEALRLEPNYPEAHYNLGLYFSQYSDKQNEALAEYSTALAFNQNYIEAHTNLAIILAQLPGGKSEAIKHLNKALELNPKYALAHCNIAPLIATDSDRISEAIDHLKLAIKLDPNLAQAHTNLASILSRIDGKGNEAVFHFSEALRINPKNAEAENNWANFLVRQGGHDQEAILHYRNAVNIAPHYLTIRFNLALLLLRNPDTKQEAVLELHKLLSYSPDYQPAVELLKQIE